MRLALIGLAALAFAAGCATPAPVAVAQQIDAPAPPAMPPRADEPRPQEFAVMLAPGSDPLAGRLIVVATPVANVNLGAFAAPWNLSPAAQSYIAAQDAPIVTPAQPVRFDADMVAFPAPMSRIKPGEYWVQVRLDVNRNAAYRYPDADNDFVSMPVKMQLPASGATAVTLEPERKITQSIMAPKPLSDEQAARNKALAAESEAQNAEANAHIKALDFVSPAVSAFWGKPMHVRGYVLLPPGYETSKDMYPTVYRTEGFGASLASLQSTARQHYNLMISGDTPPMIRVFLDHSSPWGTHEFADSVNNGPWGKALTEELIPWLETQYRMDAKPSGRFTTGHSSGGWFAIWQQVKYPEVFGGTWARAPDPVDFRSFTGVDIYAENANAYVRPDGSAQTLVRDPTGKETTSFRDYALKENVLGEFGGQMDSFDWVFSPKGNDGRAQPLFDRATGKVDPEVAAYWRENFDISHIIRRDWKTLKPALDGKIHLVMGDNDTFHLNEAARLLQAELVTLGARAMFDFIPGGTHFNLDALTGERMALERRISWEMWAVARPGSSLKPKSPPAPRATEIVRAPALSN